MKKVKTHLIFSILFCLSFSASAQTLNQVPKITAVGIDQRPATGFETSAALEGLSVPEEWLEQYYANQLIENVGKEIWMGNSYYDLMSNSATKHRVHHNVGRTSGVWTFHEGVVAGSSFPTRGSGYNSINDNSSAMSFPPPVTRLEAITRTGWANVVILDSGRELVISHSADNEIIILSKEEPTGEWTETSLPTVTASGPGLLWPHVAVSENTVHLICITTPIGLEGQVYEGMDGALLYFRSTDGGMTWDKQDVFLPGISSDNFSSFNADGYFVDANGEHVVVANFNGQAGDVDLWISDDAGENWINRKALEFPIPNYVINDGYDIDDIGGPDPDGPGGDGMGGIDPEADETDLGAIRQCDNTGSVAIEADGTVHAAFGRMYISDIDTTDAGWIFYPDVSGIFYWNTNMLDDEPIIIQETINGTDIDGNGSFDIRDDNADFLPSYGGSSITSNPYTVVNDEGYVVIAYHQVMENFVREAIDGSPTFPEPKHYRQIFMTASLDKVNWQEPYHVINEDVMLIPAIIPETEAVFPHLSVGADNRVYMTFQWDSEPGSFVRDELLMVPGEPTNNTQTYWCFDIPTIFPSVNTEVVSSDIFGFEISPNPTQGKLMVDYELVESTSSSIQVTNMMGQSILFQNNGQESIGKYTKQFDLSHLAGGMYLVTLKSEDRVAVQKLIVE